MNAQTGQQKIQISGNTSKGAKKQRGRFGKSGLPNMFQWDHPECGEIQIELIGAKFGEKVRQQGPNTWRRVNLAGKKPAELVLGVLYAGLNNDVEMLYAVNDQVIDTNVMEPDPFVVKIDWKAPEYSKPDAEEVPHLSNAKGRDFQLIVVNKTTGFSVTIDVTVVARKGVLSVTMQEVFGAQAVEHPLGTTIEHYTSVELGGRNITLIPVYDANCYPGFDPVASMDRTYELRADKVLGYFADFGAVIQLDQCVAGEWNPEWPAEVPAALAQQGYEAAIGLWFNLTTGYGFLQLKDGRSCYVHFTAIEDEDGNKVAASGDFPLLEGSKGYYVKWQLKKDKKSGEMKPAAVAVRPA